MTTPHRRLRTVALAGGGLTVLLTALLTASPGAASVPSAPTLVPPPPDGYTCQPTGGGTVCHRRMDFTHQAAYDVTCPQGFDILENGAVTELGRRTYDRAGFLVRRDLHELYPAGDPLNVFYNSVTGASVPYRADFLESDTFATPGDFDTMSARFTGNLYSATLPGSGLLVHDVGVLAFDPAGDVTVDHGPKMVFDGDVAGLCAALE